MGEEWRARLARAAAGPLGVRAGAELLALAGVGQAIAQTAEHGRGSGTVTELAALYGLPLCVLALASTLPLLLSPLPSAVVIVAANVLAFVSFPGSFPGPTVAGMIALIVATARLGAAGELGGAGLAQPGAGGARRGAGWARGGMASAPYLPSYLALFLAPALGLPFLVIALYEHRNVAAILLAALAPVAAGAGLALRSSRQAKTYSAAGEALAGTLVAHTARGERARIARELHDVVAHHISMIAVLAETGRLTTPGLPEAGARRFAEIGDTARGGLTEMRRLLGVLREDAADAEPAAVAGVPELAGASSLAGASGTAGTVGTARTAETPGAAGAPGTARPAGSGPAPGARTASRHPQPGLTQLAELIDAAREASGATARLIISGHMTPLDPGVELAAYRIVQEALTNARRHAAGAAIDVELRYAPDVLRLRVRDNGPGPGGAANSGGHGLLGMRERAFSVGGSLYTGTAPGGGFLVEAVLPGSRDDAGTRALPSEASTGSTASGASAESTASGAGGRG